MNDFMPAGFSIYQDKKVWYVWYRAEDQEVTYTYFDGMILSKDGVLLNAAHNS